MKYNCERKSYADIREALLCVFCSNYGTSVPGGRQPGQVPPVGDDVDLEGGSAVWKKNQPGTNFIKIVVITTL